MKKKPFTAFLFVLAMFVAAPLVHATTITEVQALITSLKTKSTSVIITGKSAETKDRPMLLGKLDDSTIKLDRAKFCDAVAKLNDFKAKVNALIADGQINQDPALGTTGQELLTEADAIIAGLNSLQLQSTGAACTL